MLQDSSNDIKQTVSKSEEKVNDLTSTLNKLNLSDKKTSNRCTHCNKKVGFLGFACKCGGNFCSTHRFYEDHSCVKLDEIKKEGRELILKQNPVVIGSKIDPI